MTKIYHVKVTTEDSVEWEIYITDEQSVEQATKDAMNYFIEDGVYSDEDVFELYDMTGLSINGYVLSAHKI